MPTAAEVTGLYRTHLRREPDQPGLDSWMASGSSLAKIAKGMKGSKEYKTLGPLPVTPSPAPPVTQPETISLAPPGMIGKQPIPWGGMEGLSNPQPPGGNRSSPSDPFPVGLSSLYGDPQMQSEIDRVTNYVPTQADIVQAQQSLAQKLTGKPLLTPGQVRTPEQARLDALNHSRIPGMGASTALPPVAPWLQNPATITAPTMGSGGVSVPGLSSSMGSIPQVTPPPAPQFQVPAAAQSMIDQYVRNTQQQGSQELQRQLLEDFLPSLKAAAAANGQVNNDGTVNGAFLENFSRQHGQVGRELANIVLGAQTEGLSKGLQAGQYEQEMGQQSANRAMTASSENARNYLTGAGITSQENIAKSRMALDAQIASQNADLERARISLQAQVSNGQLSLSQANLAFETAKAESQNAIDQQKLRLGMLDLLSGRELDIARLGIGAVQDADTRQNQDINMLNTLSSQDFDKIIQTLSAIKGSGGSQKTSGSALGDVMGLATAGLGGAAAIKYLA